MTDSTMINLQRSSKVILSMSDAEVLEFLRAKYPAATLADVRTEKRIRMILCEATEKKLLDIAADALIDFRTELAKKQVAEVTR